MSQPEQPKHDPSIFNRRDFVRLGAAGFGMALGGFALAANAADSRETAPAATWPLVSKPLKRVRVGFVGVGGMGTNHIRNLLRIPGVELCAVCDIVEAKAKNVQELAKKAGQKKPKAYTRGPLDFKRMCEKEDLDLVYTATPWEWHVPVCVAAMENGKHAATEVPAAVTLEECWQLVETSEKQKKHCVMMENCNYGRFELLTLNLVRKGLLGDVVYGAGGYCHDLRGVKFGKDSEGLWRRAHATKRNGNLYPTHGLGPVAQCMDVNRGNRFQYLVSLSSPSRGLQEFQNTLPQDDPRRQEKYVLGDVNVSLIYTASGQTITVIHDTNLPRPYTRISQVQGTKGIVEGYPERVYIEGKSANNDKWDTAEEWYPEHDHPLWKRHNEAAKGAGHGGMDYIEDYRLIECLLNGQPTDMDVYDAAALSAVCELSERSVANKSAMVEFPDFTRGNWKTNTPLGIIGA